jgi:hypothetical protein
MNRHHVSAQIQDEGIRAGQFQIHVGLQAVQVGEREAKATPMCLLRLFPFFFSSKNGRNRW